jgi:hypothetical protein
MRSEASPTPMITGVLSGTLMEASLAGFSLTLSWIRAPQGPVNPRLDEEGGL